MTTPTPPRDQDPAKHLLGEVLDDEWEVVEYLAKGPDDTGRTFSEAYRVRRGDSVAFAKALNYARAFQPGVDSTAVMNQLTAAYNFERDLVLECGRMNRVVQAIGSGEFRFPDVVIPVPYLIFELADGGDVRAFLRTAERFDHAWAIRTLHQVSVGLRQLHQAAIAHQDLKPSNIMIFGSDGGEGAKIGDFGQAAREGVAGPTDRLPLPGDPAYAPPEQLYREIQPDWGVRRLAADLYHLGSMATYFFIGQGTTSLLMSYLAPDHHWRRWGGTYRQVLPFIRQAFDRVMQDFDGQVPVGLRSGDGLETELTVLVRYLSDPDPLLRGHPQNRAGVGSPFSLERFVSRFNHLAERLEYDLRAA